MGTNIPSGVINKNHMIQDGKNFNPFKAAGFKFRPLEKELCYFLKQKVLGLQLPPNAIEELDDLYSYNPEELPMDKIEQWARNEAFFFTNRYSESLNATKDLRDGYWKALGGDVEVLDKRTKTIVGFRRMVVFCWEAELIGMKVNWFIHEYRVNPSTIYASNDDKDLIAKAKLYVVCKVQAKVVKEDRIPKLHEHGVLYDSDEFDFDSEEELFGNESSDELGIIERERGKRFKPALAFKDEVPVRELFPRFFKQ